MIKISDFEVGDVVDVSARPDDIFKNDFTGQITAINGDIIRVVDQEDNAWDCDLEQIEFNLDN